MGYTTYFNGHVTLDPPLNPEQVAYINAFSGTRRMKRKRGPYFVEGTGFRGGLDDPDVLEHNYPDPSQPGLWCQWVVTDDGASLEWDGGEKFYEADEWMKYFIEHFLGAEPASAGSEYVPDFGTGRICNGRIFASGEYDDDRWILDVTDNNVTVHYGEVVYPSLPGDTPKRVSVY